MKLKSPVPNGLDQSGALLISLIATMTVLASLGAMMVYFTTTSTQQELMANVRNRAYYLAESGFRYATSQSGPSLKETPTLFTNSTFSMGSNDQFILTTYESGLDSTRVIIESTGLVNQGVEPHGARRQIIYDVSKDNLQGDDIVGENLDNTQDSTGDDTFQDLSGWHSDPYFRIQSFVAGTGAHVYYAATVSPPTNPDPDHPGEQMRIRVLRLNNNSDFAGVWSGNHHLLSYDTQVKMAWGYQLEYGTEGISFRLNESSVPNKYQFYGISFMKYRRKDSSQPGPKDYIPDSIKPPASGSLADHILIVLWEQKVVTGQETRRWLAYEDVTGDVYVKGDQWAYDGQCITDNSTIMVRVHEKVVGGTRVQDVKVFYGDASSIYTARTPNTTPYDILNLRNYYWPSYEYAAGSSPYPTWPPLSISTWTTTHDYFSFIETSPAGYAVKQTQWDAVVSDITLQSDGGTLRLPLFTTPDGVSAGQTTFPSDRDEIGLHVLGEVGGNNTAMTFDDYTLRFLLTDGSTTSGFIQK